MRSDAGERLKSFLNAGSRSWLAQTLRQHKAKVYIGGGVIAYTELGLVGNDPTRERFEAAAEFLCDLAETFGA